MPSPTSLQRSPNSPYIFRSWGGGDSGCGAGYHEQINGRVVVFTRSRVYTMRQKHGNHATCVKIALCKRAYCDMRLSQESWMISTSLACDSMQQSHVAQISPFTQRNFVAYRISFVASCKRTLTGHLKEVHLKEEPGSSCIARVYSYEKVYNK